MERKASAYWRGSLLRGRGDVTTASGVLKNIPYSFATRFENAPGTNPEELVAAAHASCFSMALSGALNKAGYEAKALEVSATVTIEKEGAGYTVKSSKLKLRAQVPGIDAALFSTLTEDAKKNCPISKLLNAEITLEARLEGSQTVSPKPNQQSSAV
ncbi:OsmC family protein [Bdellovibrio svalbardensis]|uniref:OsmC family protein n=1 Tax=Bdellovibrio svalbardensis TaxID=2972972 RepID=A0ABT6DL30_9BACT|nr:OsmC family protein [Bdellovibrio svalbardensis]MDG0817582.1 OsmC family protein [Bdellovibrio svalbardensis]